MKTYKPKTIKEAINHFHQFLECDLYSKFRPEMKMLSTKKDKWIRTDYFKNEKDFIEYLNEHFEILDKQIERIKRKETSESESYKRGKEALRRLRARNT